MDDQDKKISELSPNKNRSTRRAKFKEFKKFLKRKLKFFATKKFLKIAFVALGVGGIAWSQRDALKLLISHLPKINSTIFSSDEENSKLIEKTNSNFQSHLGKSKTRKLLTFFGTILAYFIWSQYSSETSPDISVKDIPVSSAKPSSRTEFAEWFKLICSILTIIGLVTPIPGPVGVPLTPFEDMIRIMKKILIVGGYTGTTTNIFDD